jgi:predicted dienelactone hydrolase
MKKRYWGLAALAIGGLALAGGAFVVSPTIHEGVRGEAPELGRAGILPIGTRELAIDLSKRITFSKLGMATGQVSRSDRSVDVRIWYPASAAAGSVPITYNHTMTRPGLDPVTLEFAGRAFLDAPAESSQSYPLVVMSHGFNGWNTQMSNLGEHLASQGYIVASIDHRDLKIEGPTDFLHSFSLVLAQRARDQRQIIDHLLAAARKGDDPLYAQIDTQSVGLIGYSMGGFGALAVAGGDYDYTEGPVSNLPGDAREGLSKVASDPAPLGALITFAPWGGQPENRVWNAKNLSAITAPVLVVGGSEDDVSQYETGIRWIYDSLSGTNRHLLTFREARHNIVGNAFTLPQGADFQTIEFLNEPVWRQDRINAINEHFVTAFLDLHLKGDEEKRAFLDLPVSNANDSEWDIGFGEQLNGTLAGEDEADHWRGFQRRWAVGLDMESKQAGK